MENNKENEIKQQPPTQQDSTTIQETPPLQEPSPSQTSLPTSQEFEGDWYAVHTYSGQEQKVKNTLEEKIKNLSLEDKIFKVLLPTEDVVYFQKSKQKVKKRKFYPGYLFINMKIDNETYWIVRSTPGVTGFLGDTKPIPLQKEEVKNLIELTTQDQLLKPKPAIVYERGETVRIIDGPFKHFVGIIDDVFIEKAKLKVIITIFGRQTPVELDFLQVEKL